MLSSKKMAAVAGFLGGLALIGAGAVQAYGIDGAGTCVEDGAGHIRCVQVSQHEVTTDKDGNVTVVNQSTQNCPTSHSQATCVDNAVVGGAKS
ncbi:MULTISPECIES: hypothetical protein [Streptomyces]|uniref:DUF320 domain-containing protein n=1 Tax=Streptomyces cadmiisoli TaxID=2184053 RepID=A0A2Z4J3D0_9ACTN|nr:MULTISPECIES: hypothetical protein [Streptomyces]AWW39517.1 hypothetical protein DN051_25015 [Streptomyces cadmiisoli]KOV51882.1 hypothetical protein ADL00_39580 [Streptomyces sp. AS58]